jgi:hypothetical protein
MGPNFQRPSGCAWATSAGLPGPTPRIPQTLAGLSGHFSISCSGVRLFGSGAAGGHGGSLPRGCWRPTAAAREAPPPSRCTAGSCPHPPSHLRSGGLRKCYRSLNLSGSHTARDFSDTVSSSRSGDHLPPARCSTEWHRRGRRRVLCLRRR